MPLPGAGTGLFPTIKETALSGFLALPIILIIVTGFFATTTANVGMMILFLGQILGIPLVQFALSFLRGLSWIQNMPKIGPGPPISYGSFDPRCSLSPADVKDDQIVPPISYWLAHVVFFGTFVLSNAMTVYTAESKVKDPNPLKVENRTSQVLASFIVTLVLVIGLIAAHFKLTGCDTVASLIMGALIYSTLGYGFFKLAEVCGIRSADIFGIATKMFLPSSEENSYPYACVNIEKKC